MADASAEGLLGFVSAMGGERALKVEENLGEGYVRLRVSEAERRQAAQDIRCVEDAIIEILRNSRDAGARHIYVATSREGGVRTTTVLDDGVGIPKDMQERVFEARVTSKLESVHMDRWGIHGRGMALFSVRENAVSARVVSSGPGKGCAISVVTDAGQLSERADQSTWPELGYDDQGTPCCVRGPHNIVRACCEFALEERGSCEVYLGSPAEVAATARAREGRSLESSDLLFLDSLDELPVLQRLYAAADAAELGRVAGSLCLDMSERTAHRIVSGQIAPMRSVTSRLMREHRPTGEPQPKEVDLARDPRGLRLSKDDIEEFSRVLERDFDLIAQRYYLSLAQEPRIRVGGNKITVTFDLDQRD